MAEAAQAQTSRAADDFVDSIGVNTHFSYVDTAYANRAMVRDRLGESGIRHIRDGWLADATWATYFMRDEIAPLGVRLQAIADYGWGTPAAHQRFVKANLMGSTEAVEAVNEPDNKASFPSKAQQWTRDLAISYRSDPTTAALPVVCPGLAAWRDADKHRSLGDLSASCGRGNIHPYPGDEIQADDAYVALALSNAGFVAPGRRVFATETGYSNKSSGAPIGQPAMPEAQAGVMLPRLYMEYFRGGVARTFAYEFLDEHSDSNFQSGFGLLRADGSRKPAFYSVKTLISLLSDKGPAFSPGSLAFQLTGADASTRSQLLQKRDGTFWLAVWQQSKPWDGSQVLDPPNRKLTLALGNMAKSVRLYTPTRGATAQANFTSTDSVNFESSEDISLLEISGVVSPKGHRGKAVYVSDHPVRAVVNGWGPMELDSSNGEAAARDGHRLSIAERSFAKGLGVHAPSRVEVPVVGAQTFTAWIGVDNETRGRGSVAFAVWADGVRLYHSGVVRGGQRPRAFSVDVRGRIQLTLVVTSAGDGRSSDHADWADAMLA